MNRVSAMCVALGLMLLSSAVPGQVQAERKIPFELSPQPMADALSAFAAQSNLRIVLNTDDVRGLVSTRLSGSFTPRMALKMLLGNSSLRYEFVDERTVEIRSARSAGAESTGEKETSAPSNPTSWQPSADNGIHLADGRRGATDAAAPGHRKQCSRAPGLG
jgi:hypothetical protein